MLKALSGSVAVAMLVATPSGAQTLPPLLGGPLEPITAFCPAAVAGDPAARAIGRALGVPLPAPRLVPLGPATPAFGGTSRGSLTAGQITFLNRWGSAGQTRFHHIIEGPVGPARLTLETCSTATGGETVAVYPSTLDGHRIPRRPRVMFSIAVPRGNMRQATLVIPPSRRGSPTGAVHLVVVIENASGRFHNGAYRLTVAR